MSIIIRKFLNILTNAEHFFNVKWFRMFSHRYFTVFILKNQTNKIYRFSQKYSNTSLFCVNFIKLG